MDQARLLSLYSKNQLRPYATLVMRKQWFTDDKFRRLYRHHHNNIPLDSVTEFLFQEAEDDNDREKILDDIAELFEGDIHAMHSENKYPYETNLFMLYLEMGSTRKVQAATGIPYRSVARTVAGYRQKIKDKLGKEI